MRKAACFILLYSLFYSAFSQQAEPLSSEFGNKFAGRVINEQNIRLPYATVKLWVDSLEKRAVVCDSLGHFSFEYPTSIEGNIFFEAFYLKSRSEKVAIVGDKKSIILVVVDSTNLLKGITVTAQNSMLQRKADRFVFTPSKELTNGATALDLMRHTPVIQFNNKSEALSIIGKPSTIVYLNNRKSEMPNDMLIQMLRSLPASNIKSIEVITNPGSEYGADVSGGVINILLKKEPYEGWMGNLSVQAIQSVYNTTMLNGAISYRKKKLAIQAMPFVNRSYNYYTSTNTLVYVDNFREVQEKEHFRRYNVYGGGLNVDYEINNHSLLSLKSWNSVVYGKSTDLINTESGTISSERFESLLSSDRKGTDYYNYNFSNLNYHWSPTSKNNAYVDVNIDYNHFTQRRDNEGSFKFLKTFGGPPSDTTYYSNSLPQHFNNFSAKAESGMTFNKKYQLTFGFQVSTTKVDNNLYYYNILNSVPVFDSTISNHFIYKEKYGAFFASIAGQLTSTLQAFMGLRTEGTTYITEKVNKSMRADSNYLKLYPSFGISYTPDPKYQLGYSYSKKIVRPNIETLFPGRTYNTPGFFIENNPFLQPSIIDNHELSLLINKKYSFVLNYISAKNRYTQFLVPVIENSDSLMKQTYLNYGYEKGLSLMFNGSWSLFKNTWEIYFTPVLSYNHYKGSVTEKQVDVTNFSATVIYDNYIYLSRKKGWTGFVTFKYNTPIRDINGRILNTTTSLDLEVKKVYRQFSFFLIASDVYRGSSLIKSQQFANPLLVANHLEIDNYTRSLVFRIRYNFGNGKVKTIKSRQTANEEIRNRTN